MFLQVFVACVFAWIFMNAARWTVLQIGSWYYARRLRAKFVDCGCEPGAHLHAPVDLPDELKRSIEAQQRLTVAVMNLGEAADKSDGERAVLEHEVIEKARHVYATMSPAQRDFFNTHVREVVALYDDKKASS